MLGKLPGQPEDPTGDRVRHLPVEVQVRLPAGGDPVRELPRAGLSEQPGPWVGGQSQRVLSDQPAGVGVVGQHGGLAGQHRRPTLPGGVESIQHRRTGEAAQPGPDALGELLGRLAGERQAEHSVGGDVPVGDQPHHSGGHRLGLTRSGTGDHERRALWVGGDDGGLFRGGPGDPEFRSKLSGLDTAGMHRRHWVTCRPESCSGQAIFEGHRAQSPLSMATNSGPAVRRAASRTTSFQRSNAAASNGR